MRKRNFLLVLLLVGLILMLTGCRTRTTGTGNPAEAAVSAPGETDTDSDTDQDTEQDMDGIPEGGGAAGAGLTAGATDPEAGIALESGPAGAESASGTDQENPESEFEESGAKTRENPDASRKEYDENASAEIVPGTDRFLHSEGEGSGAPLTGEEAIDSASRVSEQAETPATQTLAAQEAEQKGVDPDAEEADSALTYFTVLLSSRTASLYECQRANVYWETAQDHVTVFRTSPEHALILNAGAYDVSARLLEENLKVDDGWVVRKNPGVIVKVVGRGVLGGGVVSPAAAKSEYQRLIGREGWRGTDAVRGGQVVLLSEELLEGPYLQTAAMLILAQTAFPDLFADTDPDEALQMLTEEATGTLPTGIYYYRGGST